MRLTTSTRHLLIRRGVNCSHRQPAPVRRLRRLKILGERVVVSEPKIQNSEVKSFVTSFRQASPYMVEHTGSLFVITIPGEVIAEEELFHSLLSDLQLLHSLGVQLVVVVGSRCLIDNHLAAQNKKSIFHKKYRITDQDALDAAVHVASLVRNKTEGFFARAPSVPLMRRHSKHNKGPAIGVVSGNFTVAKPKGVIDGIDFGFTGDVRCVPSQRIRELLNHRNVVLLNNLGYSASGQILNCNALDVGLHTAVQLKADKLICMHLDDIRDLELPNWLPLDDAFDMLPAEAAALIKRPPAQLNNFDGKASDNSRLMWDFELAEQSALPSSYIVSVLSCHYGVPRSHLIDATVDGGLLLELYTSEGIGTMISSDFHEGIRFASPSDVVDIESLLKPLVQNGITIQRSYDDLMHDVQNFRVFEKEGRVLGCALVKILDKNRAVAELGALSVHPDYRGQGKGDALLTFVEKELVSKGVASLVILTTRTADWFLQRGFVLEGLAHLSSALPRNRLDKIDPKRNSHLYIKTLN